MAPRDLSKTLQRALTHLNPPPVKGGKFAMPIPSHFRPAPKFVQVKDRVPFWNIAPNDKVMVVKGSEDVRGQVGTVEAVDRVTNRVFLKEPIFKVSKEQARLSRAMVGSVTRRIVLTPLSPSRPQPPSPPLFRTAFRPPGQEAPADRLPR